MKRRRPASLAVAGAAVLAVRTGEHCPQSGWWFPAQRDVSEAPTAARYISEGSVMPANSGAPALWLPSQSRPAAGKLEGQAR